MSPVQSPDPRVRPAKAHAMASAAHALLQLAHHFPNRCQESYGLTPRQCTAEAVALAESALELDAGCVDAFLAMARALTDVPYGRNEARSIISSVVANSPLHPLLGEALVRISLRDRHLANAHTWSERHLRRFPRDTSMRELYALVLLELGQADEAGAQILRALQASPRAGRLHETAQRVFLALGDHARARAHGVEADALLGQYRRRAA